MPHLSHLGSCTPTKSTFITLRKIKHRQRNKYLCVTHMWTNLKCYCDTCMFKQLPTIAIRLIPPNVAVSLHRGKQTSSQFLIKIKLIYNVYWHISNTWHCQNMCNNFTTYTKGFLLKSCFIRIQFASHHAICQHSSRYCILGYISLFILVWV